MRGRRSPSGVVSTIASRSAAGRARKSVCRGGSFNETIRGGGADAASADGATRGGSRTSPSTIAAATAVSPSTTPQAATRPRGGRQRMGMLQSLAAIATHRGPRSVGAAGVERDAANQIDGTQQLVVGHRILGRLVGIARGLRTRCGGGRLGFLLVCLVGLRRLVVVLVGRR